MGMRGWRTFAAVLAFAASSCAGHDARTVVSDEHISIQRTECGAGSSIAVEGSRVWGPTLEVSKIGQEYRGYTHRGGIGVVQLWVDRGEIRGAHSGAPVHLRVQSNAYGYSMRGLYAGQFVSFDVVEPFVDDKSRGDEVWTSTFRSRIRGPRCLGGTMSYPVAFVRLPLEDRAAIMAMSVL